MVKIEQYAEFMYELLNAQLGINQHKLIKYYTQKKVVVQKRSRKVPYWALHTRNRNPIQIRS